MWGRRRKGERGGIGAIRDRRRKKGRKRHENQQPINELRGNLSESLRFLFVAFISYCLIRYNFRNGPPENACALPFAGNEMLRPTTCYASRQWQHKTDASNLLKTTHCRHLDAQGGKSRGRRGVVSPLLKQYCHVRVVFPPPAPAVLKSMGTKVFTPYSQHLLWYSGGRQRGL